MTYFSTALLAVALFVVGCQADRNAHQVDHTDACESLCQYYGKVCPIQTFVPTGPGFDCNRGYCRFKSEGECVAFPRNARYVESTDNCESLCEYYGQPCPIETFAPNPPGFDCNGGYCRREAGSQCLRMLKF